MELILLTSAVQPTAEVLPALGLLSHQVTVLPQDAGALVDRSLGDAVLVDARRDLMNARAFVRLLAAMGTTAPVIGVLTEGGLIAMSGEWAVDDFVLDTAGPAELDARLRRAVERQAAQSDEVGSRLEVGELTIDESTYTARLSGVALDLTYKEFELLKFLALHPGRVFTRSHLVQEVWGYDYFGGTRTVDVHVRRLRAKLGSEHEAMIGTVRNVGYKFVRPADERPPRRHRRRTRRRSVDARATTAERTAVPVRLRALTATPRVGGCPTSRPDRSTSRRRAAVVALAGRIEAEDGAPPLSDQTLTRLSATDVDHVIARAGGAVVGYAQRDGDGAEVAAEPAAVAPLLDAVARARRLLLWSHGRRSRLVAALTDSGFERVRELHQLRRPLRRRARRPAPLPAGVDVRAFRPGADDAAWLAVNAAAFASHPEQGRWTQADLQARIDEPWFDAAGFLLADRDGELLGYHWTKMHPGDLGEVYVLGIAPAAQGLGLGAHPVDARTQVLGRPRLHRGGAVRGRRQPRRAAALRARRVQFLRPGRPMAAAFRVAPV